MASTKIPIIVTGIIGLLLGLILGSGLTIYMGSPGEAVTVAQTITTTITQTITQTRYFTTTATITVTSPAASPLITVTPLPSPSARIEKVILNWKADPFGSYSLDYVEIHVNVYSRVCIYKATVSIMGAGSYDESVYKCLDPGLRLISFRTFISWVKPGTYTLAVRILDNQLSIIAEKTATINVPSTTVVM